MSLILLLFGCGLETQTLSQFHEGNFDEITRVTIIDGSTGFRKTVIEEEVVEDFIGKVQDTKFIPLENQSDRVGTLYSVVFYEGEEEVLAFTPNSVKDDYYRTEPDIIPVLKEFYQNLDVEEYGPQNVPEEFR